MIVIYKDESGNYAIRPGRDEQISVESTSELASALAYAIGRKEGVYLASSCLEELRKMVMPSVADQQLPESICDDGSIAVEENAEMSPERRGAAERLVTGESRGQYQTRKANEGRDSNAREER